jgi:hypothetical protein
MPIERPFGGRTSWELRECETNRERRILAKSSMNLYLYLQKTDPLKSHLTFIILANVYLVLIRRINSP